MNGIKEYWDLIIRKLKNAESKKLKDDKVQRGCSWKGFLEESEFLKDELDAGEKLFHHSHHFHWSIYGG